MDLKLVELGLVVQLILLVVGEEKAVIIRETLVLTELMPLEVEVEGVLTHHMVVPVVPES